MNRMPEDQFVNAICAQLDASIERLDPAITAQLDKLRSNVICHHSSATPSRTDADLLRDVQSKLRAIPELPPVISARLDSARRQAVSNLRERESNSLQALTLRIRYTIASLLDMSQLARPAHMLATACVMVTVVSLFYVSSRPVGTLPLEEEMVLIASAEDFELYENLDFYLWLADNGLPN